LAHMPIMTTNESHLHYNALLYHHADCCRNIGDGRDGKGEY